MLWDRLKRLIGHGPTAPKSNASAPELPEIHWLADSQNPWGVPILDVRPVTHGMLSVTQNEQCATNAISFRRDDGTSFIGVEPQSLREIPVGLQFRIDRMLADGALFIPEKMEHKWAIYFHQGKIILIRSWLRQVAVVAETRTADGFLKISRLRGYLDSEDEPAEFSVRMLDFLMRTHALDEEFPAPLRAGMEADPSRAALWCMSCFGERVQFATPHSVKGTIPEQPLRTHSLLHIAVARGDLVEAQGFLEAGVPPDLMARDGLPPLHWALATDNSEMLKLLLDRGSPVDVRSIEGATPLMTAAQARSPKLVAFLLDHGADPNATDGRGFTALHRAAEMGEKEIVRLLMTSGASPHVEAHGHTPRSLAVSRGEKAILQLLDGR